MENFCGLDIFHGLSFFYFLFVVFNFMTLVSACAGISFFSLKNLYSLPNYKCHKNVLLYDITIRGEVCEPGRFLTYTDTHRVLEGTMNNSEDVCIHSNDNHTPTKGSNCMTFHLLNKQTN